SALLPVRRRPARVHREPSGAQSNGAHHAAHGASVQDCAAAHARSVVGTIAAWPFLSRRAKKPASLTRSSRKRTVLATIARKFASKRSGVPPNRVLHGAPPGSHGNV